MSKRLCISLLHTPSRSQQPLQRCSLRSISGTVRGDLHRSKPTHGRPFTTTRHQAVSAFRQVTNRKPSQPSMTVSLKSQQQRAQDTGLILDHIGIIEGTFVPPTGRNLPSPIRNLRGRLKLEYRRLKQSIIDFGRNHFQRFFLITPRPKLGRREAPKVAKRLYEAMYAHFARGDLSPVESALAPGLMSSLRSRIAQRPPNSSLLWTLHGYLSKPTVVSHKLAMMPGKNRKNTEQIGIEQVIVRIRSRQSLMKMQKMKVVKQGKSVVENVPVESNGERISDEFVEQEKRRMSKTTTEYVVVQRHMKKSKFGPWHLWGTAEESTLEKIKRDEKKHNDTMLRMAAQR